MAPRSHDVIPPSNILKAKAAAPGGISEFQAVAAGNRVIAAIGAGYADHAADDLALLDRMLSEVLSSFQTFGAHNEFYRKLHDLQGQAGTFGYDLITEIANSLCHYLDRLAQGVADQTVLVMHLEAMRVVLNQKLKGTGGPAEREMIAGLAGVVRRLLG